MVTVYEQGELTWVDMASPSHEEVRDIAERFGVELRIAEEITSPTPKPAALRSGETLFLILHFPASKHTHQHERNQEIDFIIKHNALITVRYDTVDAMHKFAKQFEVNSILDHDEAPEHAGIVAVALLRKLYRSVEHEMDYLRDRLREVECNIFAGKEKEMVGEISRASREALNFKQTMRAHRGIMERFRVLACDFFGTSFCPALDRLAAEHERVCELVQSSGDALDDLRKTNDSLLYTKQNEIMKTLTIMAFVTFPLTLITSVFGMNTATLPLIGQKNDFWVIIGIMAVLTLFFFAYFKHKRWL